MKAIVNAKLVFPDKIEDGTILIENGKILASGNVIPPAEAEIIDAKGAYVGPGLVDIHCHGYAQAGEKPEFYSVVGEPLEVANAHLKSGTTSITVTISYSSPPDVFLSAIEKARAAKAKGDNSIIGIHFEGPFLNPQYGANSKTAWSVTQELCDRIFDAAGEDVLHCTYAPEVPGAEIVEDCIHAHGVVADIGHTALSPADAERAVGKGAKIVTHLFDAMGSWRGKESISETGIIQESADTILLAIPGLYYELICDQRGVHVKPYNVKLALRTAGEDHIILVTDCVSRVSHDPSVYPKESPMSAPDINYNDLGELSGSRLILSDACRNFMQFTGSNVRVAFKCASTNPAKVLGVDHKVGSILPGRDANLLMVDEAFRLQSVYFRGEKI